MIYTFSCAILRFLCRVLFPLRLHGTENIPEKGSCIVASNHVSYIDPVVMAVFVRRPFHFLAKRELLDSKIGWLIRRLRIIPVERDALKYSSAKKIIEKIKEGHLIAIFPEGTRGDGKEFLEPEPGVGYFALKFKIPVIPVYIKGTDKVLPKGAYLPKRRRVDVYYGAKMTYAYPAGLTKDRAYKEVANRIMDEIRSMKLKYG